MTEDIRDLLQLNVEMEGLLHVLSGREVPHAVEALERKAAEFNAKVNALIDTLRPTVLKEAEAEAPEMIDSFDVMDKNYPSSEGEEVPPTVLERNLDAPGEEVPPTLDPEAEQAIEAQPQTAPVTPPTNSTVEATEAQLRTSAAPELKHADISRAFSLNDRFLYARELFGGNTQRFLDVVAGLSRMTSFAEVEDYLTNGLGLDLSSPVAKEFAERIRDNMPS